MMFYNDFEESNILKSKSEKHVCMKDVGQKILERPEMQNSNNARFSIEGGL